MFDESNDLVPRSYFLEPGHIVVITQPAIISTVLGSCVAVCICDSRRMVGGMNHFQLPRARDPKKATARYGDAATLALIRMMIKEGSETRHLEAQVFGGACNREVCSKDVGRENVMVAKKVLAARQVRVVSEDVGGEKGRKLVFNTDTNEIAVVKVESLRRGDWYPYCDGR